MRGRCMFADDQGVEGRVRCLVCGKSVSSDDESNYWQHLSGKKHVAWYRVRPSITHAPVGQVCLQSTHLLTTPSEG